MKQLMSLQTLILAVMLVLAGCQANTGRHGPVGDPSEFNHLLQPFGGVMDYEPPRYAGEIQPFDQSVTIGNKLPERIRMHNTMDISIRYISGSSGFWFSGQYLVEVEEDGENVVLTSKVEDLYAGGEEGFADAVRQMKGSSTRILLDKNRVVQDISIEGGQLPGNIDSGVMLQQAEGMLKNILGPIASMDFRGKPFRQGDMFADLSVPMAQISGKYWPLNSYVRGYTEYLGRPCLLATVNYEDTTTGAKVTAYDVVDIETGFALMSTALFIVPRNDGTIMETRVTLTVTEFQ